MKRKTFVGLTFVEVLLLSVSALGGPVAYPGVYSSSDGDDCNGYFETKFWKEKFFGSGPGQAGNVLMAFGQGFILQNVVLDNVEPCETGDCGLSSANPCYLDQWAYKTTYKGGFLRLNRQGPWLKRGKLKATNLEPTNYSFLDPDGNLHFCLVVGGPFKNAPAYSFNIVAKFDGTPDKYEVRYDEESDAPVFQRGYDFDAVIQILEPEEPR
jgi:hypothetical protein